jgi:hypothetical protein
MPAAMTGVRVTQRVSADGKSTYEEIEPLVPLAAKVTLGDGIDADMLARAEAAVAEMAAGFPDWATQDLLQMREVAATLRAHRSAEQGQALYVLAHDMKGQGGSFGYPLISTIAGSLCRLLHRRTAFEPRHLAAIDAHLDAAGTVLARRMSGDQGPAGATLTTELQTLVAMLK